MKGKHEAGNPVLVAEGAWAVLARGQAGAPGSGDAEAYDGDMSDGSTDATDSTGGLGRYRTHSAAIRNVRLASAIAAMGSAVLAIASPLVLALTVGTEPGVTIGLSVTAIAAAVVLVSTYPAERREIARRIAREER